MIDHPPRLKQAVQQPELLKVELGQVLVADDGQDLRVRKPEKLKPLAQLAGIVRQVHSSSMPRAGQGWLSGRSSPVDHQVPSAERVPRRRAATAKPCGRSPLHRGR